jgi:hypothetical protein
MQHARGTLNKIYANAVQHFAGEQTAVVAWPLACGSKIARRTAALSCIDGELAVRVPDKLWRNQLDCLSNQYLAALNQVSRQKVKRIRFVATD